MNIYDGVINKKKELYERDGFVVLSNFFDDEYVKTLILESNRLLLIANNNKESNPIKFNQVNSQIYRIDPIINISKIYKNLLKNKNFINILEFFEGSEISLLKDKLIYKPAGSRGYPMHQDYAWCQGIFPSSLFSVMISLCKANEKNGAVKFFKGYHDKLLSTENEIRHMNQNEVKQVNLEKGVIVELNMGDIVIFKGLTPHQSSENLSNESRPLLYFSFNHKKDGNFYNEYWNQYEKYSQSTLDINGNYINPYESK
ncbi:MAG: phytanoyl-CoA dioxygenase family protein [Saprospiraceae bacterium]|nr:phytanoyl-CoA dioxygenase family protein [Candidatus Defluviibacterium haderslevense]